MIDKGFKVPLLSLTNLKEGIFLSRPNRFVSEIKYRNRIYTAHIHDPGRLTELLIRNSKILFTESKGKLDYYVKAVKCEREWVLIDTALHSKIALQVFKQLNEFKYSENIKKEVKVGKSRIDFVLDGVPLEVKGVTLVRNNVALFPDAPTKRGTRHVQEIIDHKGIIMFLVFRNATSFKPNWETDKVFSKKISEARRNGVPIFAIQLSFDGEIIFYKRKIPLAKF
jgi:sugar fermentation stimulation protein A